MRRQVAMILACGAVLLPMALGPGTYAAAPVKPKKVCHAKLVTKRVHGKKRRVAVKVCTVMKPVTARPTATATPSPTATATASPAPSPTPSTSPTATSPEALSVQVSLAPDPIPVGASPTLTAQATPGATCTATVTYSDGTHPVPFDSSPHVSMGGESMVWTWYQTTMPRGNASVTCHLAGLVATASLNFLVTPSP